MVEHLRGSHRAEAAIKGIHLQLYCNLARNEDNSVVLLISVTTIQIISVKITFKRIDKTLASYTCNLKLTIVEQIEICYRLF